jgi:hypothetical protein
MGPEATLSGGSHIDLNSTTFTSDADWSTDTANVRQYISRIDGAGTLTVSAGTLLDMIAPRFTHDTTTIAMPVVNAGTVQCRSGVSHSACYITGAVTNEPGGVIRVLGDGAWGHALAYLTGGLTNRGEVELTTLTPGYGAAMGVSGGPLTNEPGGVIGGTGTLNVTATTFTNDGDVRPGDPTGLLYVSGAYNQSATGVLEIELGGYEAGVDADQLEVGQAATLAGTLRIALVDGFRPATGDSFTIMTYASRSGTFDPVELIGFPPEAEVDVQFGSTAAVLHIVSMPTIPGDVDGDGVVDVDDYVLFSDCIVGPDDPLPPDCETADVDGDSDVDLDDFKQMQIAFEG